MDSNSNNNISNIRDANDFSLNQNNNSNNSNSNIISDKTKHLPFTFILIFTINFLLYLATIINLDMFDYALCQWPILFKHQYYRIITHNFFHLGLVHISFTSIFFFFVSRDLELKLGSAFVFLFISNSILLISFIYLLQIAILKYFIITLLKFTEYDFNNSCSVGFSGVLFCLYYIQCNFKNVSESNTYFFGLIPVKWKYSPYIYLIFTQVLSPNSSLLGHLSGILAGYLLKNVFIYCVIPGKDSIEGFESKFKCVFDLLARKMNYFIISAVEGRHQDEEIKEIDRRICDLWGWRYLRTRNEIINASDLI